METSGLGLTIGIAAIVCILIFVFIQMVTWWSRMSYPQSRNFNMGVSIRFNDNMQSIELDTFHTDQIPSPPQAAHQSTHHQRRSGENDFTWA